MRTTLLLAAVFTGLSFGAANAAEPAPEPAKGAEKAVDPAAEGAPVVDPAVAAARAKAIAAIKGLPARGTLKDGRRYRIFGRKLQIGDAKDGARLSPAAAGEYVLADGTKLKIADDGALTIVEKAKGGAKSAAPKHKKIRLKSK